MSGKGRFHSQRMFQELQRQAQEMREQVKFDRTGKQYQRDLKKHIDAEFRQMTDALRRMPSFGSDGIYDLYFESRLVRRRTAAIIQTMPEAVARFAAKYPELNMEHEFIEINRCPFGQSYDMIEDDSYISTAVAIFILDELDRVHRLNEAAAYLPTDEIYTDFLEDLPEDFHDCKHDSTLISALVRLIQDRNMEQKGFDSFRTFLDAAAANQTKPVPVARDSSRRKLDAILAMLNPYVVKRAEARFTEKVWECFDMVLGFLVPYRKKQKKLADLFETLMGDMERCQAEYDALMGRKTSRNPSGSPLVIPGPVPVFEPSSAFSRNAASRVPFASDASPMDEILDRMWAIAERADDVMREYQNLRTKQEMIRIHAAGPWTSKQIEPEIRKAMEAFTVENPYETCFAFFSLLDSGSDIPWLVLLGSAVIGHAAALLPWEKQENPGVDEFYEELRNAEEQSGPEEERAETTEDTEEAAEADWKDPHLMYETYLMRLREEEPRDWIDAEAKLYQARFTDASLWPEPERAPKEKLFRLNLPQLVYAYTGVVLPRQVSEFEDDLDALPESNVEPEAVFYLKTLFQLANDQRKKFSFLPASAEEPPAAEEPEPDNNPDAEEPEAFKQLKAENSRLRSELIAAERTASEERKKRAQIEAERQAEQRELYDLREMIYQLDGGENDESGSSPDTRVAFPYETRKRMVVFGGHDSWLKVIRPMLPTVRFISPDLAPSASMIRHADTVWLQTNALSHGRFYKIVEVVRAHGIPLRYFSYASAEKCARQLVEADRSG